MRMGTTAARWVLLATVLGSGVAFLDGTIVNVALPAIAEDLDATLGDLQWVLNGYLVTLSAFVLLGGSLGDRYGRKRVFLLGLGGFTIASIACGLAPNVGVLIAARAVQGLGAALLVPGSLAIIAAVFDPEDRARAVGAWSGLGGIAGAIGPFVGGYLVDSVSWRVAFLVNVPMAVAVIYASRHVPESRAPTAGHLDLPGALTASAGLALATYGLIESEPPVGLLGVATLVGFLIIEARSPGPMLPLALFRNRQFSGANGTTLAAYAAFSGAFFLLVLQLQVVLGYSALEAGAAVLPVTLLMLALSARAGALAQRIGPRLPMTIGPFGVAAGLVLWSRVDAGSTYVGTVLPGAFVFGLGLSLTVAPLTATIMASADDEHLGAASGVNNAVARLAGLLAVAILPVLVGLDTSGPPSALDRGVDQAMLVSAVLAMIGGLIAFATVRRGAIVATPTQASPAFLPCGHPCLSEDGATVAAQADAMSEHELGDGLKAGVNGRIAGRMDEEAVRPPVGDFERAAVPGEPPVAGAQWDELYRRWEVWDEATQDWVAVGDDLGAPIAPAGENSLPSYLARVTLAADDLATEHVTPPERRLPEPGPAPEGAQWNEVIGRWERWDAATDDWVAATEDNEPR